MFKFIALMKKKKGLTREQFIHHYENVYIPKMLELFADHFKICREYRRIYLSFDDPFSSFEGYPEYEGTESGAGFDVIMECVFDTREQAEAFASANYRDPDAAAIVRAEGEKFIENHSARTYVVDVHETDLAAVR